MHEPFQTLHVNIFTHIYSPNGSNVCIWVCCFFGDLQDAGFPFGLIFQNNKTVAPSFNDAHTVPTWSVCGVGKDSYANAKF